MNAFHIGEFRCALGPHHFVTEQVALRIGDAFTVLVDWIAEAFDLLDPEAPYLAPVTKLIGQIHDPLFELPRVVLHLGRSVNICFCKSLGSGLLVRPLDPVGALVAPNIRSNPVAKSIPE